MRFIVALLLLAGCTENNRVISMQPLTSYVPTVDQAGQLTYDGNTVHVNGYVGQFKIKIANLSDGDLTGVYLSATVNDPSLVGDIFFSRIYHEIFWGGSVFTNDSAHALLAPEITPPFNGYFTTLDGDDLPGHNELTFDSVVLGNPGLKINLEIWGNVHNHVAYDVEDNGITIEFN